MFVCTARQHDCVSSDGEKEKEETKAEKKGTRGVF